MKRFQKRKQPIAGLIAIVGLVVVSLVVGTGTAHATFLGVNGKITFTSRVGGHNDLFQFDQKLPPYQPFEAFPTGSVNTPKFDQNALWSPDGLELAFASSRDGDFEIYVWNSISGATRQLTFNKVEDEGPGWSPDGTHIVFSREVKNTPANRNKSTISKRDVFTMTANGDDQRNLTNHAGLDSGRAWSPDGNEILFTSDRDGDWEIYGMDPNGGSLRQLTSNSVADFGADWSPDGTQILFVREPASREETSFGDSQVWTMAADGTAAALLANNGSGVDKQATWSPDGTKIAWASTTAASGSDFELYEANADGTGIVRLTDDAEHQFTPDYRPIP